MQKEDELCDALLYRSDLGEKHRLATFFNLASNAVTYGMAMGSVRTGLGTDLPVGKSTDGPSLYYQALHAYSAFDWEFQRQLFARDAETQPLPREVSVLAGRFSKAFVDGFTNEDFAEVATVQRLACALVPSLKPFAFRRLEGIDQSTTSEKGVTYSVGIREKLWQGSQAKLDAIADTACRVQTMDLEAKLVTMASAYAPLCTVYGASFDDQVPEKSFTRLAVYLPALHTLHADDIDDPSKWHLERGIPSVALPAPLQISATRITHVRYLRDADRSRHQGMVLNVRRDFHEPQRVKLRVGFGRFFASNSDDLLGFDGSDHRDALQLVLHGHVPSDESDSPRTRAAKERANRAMEGFSIEARVHRLTLYLNREARADEDREELLRPLFSNEESKISFRIERHVRGLAERLSLQAAGFSFEESSDGSGYLCWREFWTWDRLREFFGGESSGGGGLAGMLVTSREKLLGQAIGRATKVVLDHSIESIEKSLDDEIARIVSDGLERYATARDVLAGRLHKGLF